MQTNTDPEQRIGGGDVARLCGVEPMTLWRWRKQRGFPTPARIGNRNFWRRADVLEWLERHESTEAAQ